MPTPGPGPRNPATATTRRVPTGIDYLALLDAQHDRQLAGRVNYAALDGSGQQEQARDGEQESGKEEEQGK